MMFYRFIIAIALLLAIQSASSQSWKTHPYAPKGSRVVFPKDEGVHNAEPIEWWYTVGHVTGVTTGTQYSYMLTYFHYPQFGFQGFRILNICDDDKGLFYGETLPVNYPVLAKDSLNIKSTVLGRGTETWTNKTTAQGKAIPFEYQLKAASQSGSLQLEYISQKRPLILADSGYFPQGATNYTYYYSQTDNTVTGSITIGNTTEQVTGTAWIDRQYGSFNPVSGEKYEWFNLQLSNGMDLNLFAIFTKDNRTPSTINYKTLAVYVDSTTQYTTADFHLERLAFRYTSDSLQCYSSKWRLTSTKHNIDVVMVAPHNDYEVKLPFRFYEGSTDIAGTVDGKPVTGKGFAELLHAYEKPKVVFVDPANESIQWKLTNPDDARPLKYDLSYRLDDGSTNYTPLASGISDSVYHWSARPKGVHWLKLVAYSIDSTLVTTLYQKIDPTTTALEGAEIASRNYRITQDLLELDLTQFPSHLTFELTDLQGKKIPLSNHREGKMLRVPLSQMPSGIYMIRMQWEGGKQTVKFCKE